MDVKFVSDFATTNGSFFFELKKKKKEKKRKKAGVQNNVPCTNLKKNLCVFSLPKPKAPGELIG